MLSHSRKNGCVKFFLLIRFLVYLKLFICIFAVRGFIDSLWHRLSPMPQLVEKVCFFKKVLIPNPYPQTPSPREGAECGAAALTPLGATPQTPFLKLCGFIDSLRHRRKPMPRIQLDFTLFLCSRRNNL